MDKDPLVQYIVVRESLGMGSGKVGSQVGHAVQLLIQTALARQVTYAYKSFATAVDGTDPIVREVWAWLNDGSSAKIVLGADEKEWAKVKALSPPVIVIDEGRTEIPPNSETVISFWPLRKSTAPRLLRRLRMLP